MGLIEVAVAGCEQLGGSEKCRGILKSVAKTL